jgi:hypothetical protein
MNDSTITIHTTCRTILPCMQGGLSATFTYDPARPFDVTLTISANYDSVTWLVSRDILAEGMHGLAGLADVQAYPLGSDLVLVFDGVSEDETQPSTATIAVPAFSVAAFLDRTAMLVPYGQEGQHLDLDRELAELLG